MRTMEPTTYLRHRRRNEIWLWLAYLALNGMAQVGVALRDVSRISAPFDRWEPVVWELTSLAMLGFLLPVLLAFDRRFPLTRPNLLRHATLHVAFTVPFSLLHVGGMVAQRKGIYWLAGRHYEFGPLGTELIYEFSKDFRTYFGLIAIVYLYRLTLRRWQGEAGFLSQGTESAPPQPVEDRFLVKKLGREFLVSVGDIDWIEASGNYVNLHVAGRIYPMRDTMTAMQERLAKSGFARAHRSAIVNLCKVRHLEPLQNGDARLALCSDESVPVSRRYRQAIRDQLQAG
ncbi:MAG: LytR/AlgR family response regulator transcription factor [Gammaproteobacteria bacterium]